MYKTNLRSISKQVTLPEFYLSIIERYIELGIFQNLTDAFRDAIRDLIMKTETILADYKISIMQNIKDAYTDKCNTCNKPRVPANCQDCIEDANKQVDIIISKIGDLHRYLTRNNQNRPEERLKMRTEYANRRKLTA